MSIVDRLVPSRFRPVGLDGVPSAPTGPPADARAPLLARILDEVRAGLPNEKRGRLDDLRVNDDYYNGRFDAYTTSWRLDPRSVRTLPVVRAVANHLAAHLYRASPARTIRGYEDAAAWLEPLYRRNHVDPKFQEADRITAVTDLAVFEVRGMTGPGSERRPVALDLWAGDQVAVWLDPDDVMTPFAVATLDRYDHQRRCRIWTADYRYTFLTRRWPGPGHVEATAGATAYFLDRTDENPYRDVDGEGIIPFAFIHYNYPATYFHSGGPGTGLRRANEHVNYRLSKMADDVLHWRLKGIVSNARADWNFPRDMKAGEWVEIPPAVIDASGAAVPAEAEYLAPPLEHLQHDRDDLNSWLDTALQLEGLPAAAWRLEQTGTMSGIAIMAEQLPLVLRARQRQRPFAVYEQELARVVLRVAAAHARANGVDALPLGESEGRADVLEAAAAEGELHVRFAEPSEELPGPIRDSTDTFQLSNQVKSRTMWVMERLSMDRDQAEEFMAQVGVDLARESQDLAATEGVVPDKVMGMIEVAPQSEEQARTPGIEPADEQRDDSSPESPAAE